MIGTLGGLLNLWTGITVLVFIEIGEMLLKIMRGFWSGNNGKKMNRPSENKIGN